MRLGDIIVDSEQWADFCDVIYSTFDSLDLPTNTEANNLIDELSDLEITIREKGCEHCNHHIPVNNFTKDYSIEVDDVEVSLWENLNCLAHIKINYCPMCGRKLVKK